MVIGDGSTDLFEYYKPPALTSPILSSCPKKAKGEKGTRIIGGKESELHGHPWQVSIDYKIEPCSYLQVAFMRLSEDPEDEDKCWEPFVNISEVNRQTIYHTLAALARQMSF